MEHDHLNKPSIPFQMYGRHGIWWNLKLAVFFEEKFNNIMILYMYTAQGQGKITLAE